MTDEERGFFRPLFGVVALIAVVVVYVWTSPAPTVEAIPENHGSDSVWYWQAIPAHAQWFTDPDMQWQAIPMVRDAYLGLRAVTGGKETLIYANPVKDNPRYNKYVTWVDAIHIQRATLPVTVWAVDQIKLLLWDDDRVNRLWDRPPPINARFEDQPMTFDTYNRGIRLTTPFNNETKFNLLDGEVLEIGEMGKWRVLLRRTSIYDFGHWEVAVPQ